MAEQSYRARRAEARASRIARARANMARGAVSLAPPAMDERSARSRSRLGASISLAVACHAGAAYAALEASPAWAAHAKSPPERVRVQVVEAPPPPPPAAVEVEEPPQPSVPPRPQVAHAPRKAERAAPAPSKPADTPPPLTVVGLTLESTSATGTGQVFAVGNSLAGQTERVARAPENTPPALPTEPTPSRNRKASLRVAAGVSVTPARRLGRVEPAYPALLRQQGIEADVTVRVHLTVTGTVERVELVSAARDAAFDEAALAAAQRERFAPETHDGAPVATAITYTYRFRITP